MYRMDDRNGKLDCNMLPAIEVSDVLCVLVRCDDAREEARYLHIEKIPNAKKPS